MILESVLERQMVLRHSRGHGASWTYSLALPGSGSNSRLSPELGLSWGEAAAAEEALGRQLGRTRSADEAASSPAGHLYQGLLPQADLGRGPPPVCGPKC